METIEIKNGEFVNLRNQEAILTKEKMEDLRKVFIDRSHDSANFWLWFFGSIILFLFTLDMPMPIYLILLIPLIMLYRRFKNRKNLIMILTFQNQKKQISEYGYRDDAGKIISEYKKIKKEVKNYKNDLIIDFITFDELDND